jgi:hypothetical protein
MGTRDREVGDEFGMRNSECGIRVAPRALFERWLSSLRGWIYSWKLVIELSGGRR